MGADLTTSIPCSLFNEIDLHLLSSFLRSRKEILSIPDLTSEQDLGEVYISVVTAAEIHFGFEILEASHRRAKPPDLLSNRLSKLPRQPPSLECRWLCATLANKKKANPSSVNGTK